VRLGHNDLRHWFCHSTFDFTRQTTVKSAKLADTITKSKAGIVQKLIYRHLQSITTKQEKTSTCPANKAQIFDQG
jgi:hypothetical protein